MTNATVKTQHTVQTAIDNFQTNGDDYRQCFLDRLENIKWPSNQTYHAVYDLICYSNAIQTESEFESVCDAIESLVRSLGNADRQQLGILVKDVLKWAELDDCPRDRLWVLCRNELGI